MKNHEIIPSEALENSRPPSRPAAPKGKRMTDTCAHIPSTLSLDLLGKIRIAYIDGEPFLIYPLVVI